MPANLQEEIFKRAQENSHFAKVLGFGLGHVFSYLDNELQNKIVQKSNENNPLATGLSIELGDVYYYLSDNNNEDLHNRRFREIDITKVLAKSIGTRLSNNFSCLKEHNLLQKVWTKAQENLEFAKGICTEEDFEKNNKYLEELHVGQRIICSWWYEVYDDNDMSSGKSVDSNFGLLVYTVTATTGNNTSYTVIVDLGMGKTILILPIVCLQNSGITTNSSEKLFQNEQNGTRVDPDST